MIGLGDYIASQPSRRRGLGLDDEEEEAAAMVKKMSSKKIIIIDWRR